MVMDRFSEVQIIGPHLIGSTSKLPNMGDNKVKQNSILEMLRSWFMPKGRLRKKQLQDQSTELLGGIKSSHQNGVAGMEPGVDYINPGEEDQMEVYGYRYSVLLSTITWICIVLTAGLLRLVFHWTPHWWLLVTHVPCGLAEAEKVLCVEKFQRKHKCYHVKTVRSIHRSDLKNFQQNGWENSEFLDRDAMLSVHISGGVFQEVEEIRLFTCKKVRYIWDSEGAQFIRLRGLDWQTSTATLHRQRGLSESEQLVRRVVFGGNNMDVPVRTIVQLLFLEVLNPFYVFQFFSFILWFLDTYYYYASAIMIMSAYGIGMSIFQTRRNQLNLRNTVQSSDVAQVLRAGVPVDMSTELLVPGDVIVIPPHGCVMHCDAVLLTGNCIVNESMLTGESVPVTKTSSPSSHEELYDSKEHARHTLFNGTRVIQTRYFGGERVLAVVIRTGFSTSKGSLIRSIMYPPPVDFKFEQDSYKFVMLLACIATIGFIHTVITKAMRGISARDICVEALDLITVVVPPALPAAMTVGRMYAQSRLEKENIFCISPRCINVSGSVNCLCFDKTGTLTEDGLDMWGVVPANEAHFQVPVRRLSLLTIDDKITQAMASCHSLTIIDGKLMGDPLDLKMFESIEWTLEEPEVNDNSKFDMIFPTVVRPPNQTQNSENPSLEIGIVRQFPFSSNLQRMSVVVRVLGGTNYTVFCKGSPEMVMSLSVPTSIPSDFHSVLEEYTQQGYRVLALGSKVLTGSYVKVQRANREDIESGLTFLGFVVLENQLKPETSGIINALTRANIRSIMVTGDNIQTSLSVARNCGMIPPGKQVVVVHGVTPIGGQPAQLFFTQMLRETTYCSGNDTSYMSNLTTSNSFASLQTMESGMASLTEDGPVSSPNQPSRDFVLAMTGRTWSVIKSRFPELIPRIVTRGTVFARMSPEQKQQLIQELQNLGYYVGMCGDGANDCGALKAAHTGISLSEAESSVASPFTSKEPNISCVLKVIREGRAALVTSFSIFKYMAAYSMTQFISVMILYSIDSNLTDVQYLFIDLFIITAFAFFLGRTAAYDGPLAKTPPMDSLISLPPVLSLILQLIVVGVLQLISYFYLQRLPWFVSHKREDPKDDYDGYDVACYENYTIFSVSAMQYIILAVVFSKGPPYRRSIVSNYGLLASVVGLSAMTIYLILGPAEWLRDQFELQMPEDIHYREMILIYGLVNLFLALFIEEFIVDYIVEKKVREKDTSGDKCKKYLKVEREIREDVSWPPLSSEPPPVAIHNHTVPRSPATIAEVCGDGVHIGTSQ